MKLGACLLLLRGRVSSQSGDSCGATARPQGLCHLAPGATALETYPSLWHAFWPPPHPGHRSQKSRERTFVGNRGCEGEDDPHFD